MQKTVCIKTQIYGCGLFQITVRVDSILKQKINYLFKWFINLINTDKSENVINEWLEYKTEISSSLNTNSW